MKYIVCLIFFMFLALSAQIDSLSITNSGYPYKRIEREYPTKGQAIIWSVFFPGGGHFYLGNKKTGIAYAIARLLIIPGAVLCIDNFPLFNDHVNKAELNLGKSLLLISGLAFWADIIHAGYSAKHYKPVIYEDNKKQIGYGIKADLENNRYGLELTYTFK